MKRKIVKMLKKMIQSKEEQRIICYSAFLISVLSLIVLGLSFFIDFIKWTYIIALISGYFGILICFLKSNYIITNLVNRIYERPKKTMILNNLVNLGIYIFILLLNFFIGDVYHMFLAMVGLLSIKFTVIFIFGVVPQGGDKID